MTEGWAEGELEAARKLSGDPNSRLSRDERSMIVEDRVDRRRKSVRRIQRLWNLDAVANAIVDQGVNLWQIDSLRKGAVGA